MKKLRILMSCALLAGSIDISHAKTLAFHATLTGKAIPTNTGSAARGVAQVRVDLARRTVSLDLRVAGIPLDGLWDRLVAAPIGPIHFHQYGSQNYSGDDVVLVMPVPFGPAYRATRNGFRVRLNNLAYDTGAGLVQSTAPFEAFVKALQSGTVILNIHTDKFQDGEISGVVTGG